MINVHAIRTGSVRIKKAQRGDQPGGMLGILTSSEWTDWLPIYAWLIDHPEGPILVDTGETARTADPDYFTPWHPYYRLGLQMDVKPEDEVGPQLRKMGVDPREIRTVILTHLHTDHAGGLHHFPTSRIYAPGPELQKARGFRGKARGYLPHRWPAWFSPDAIPFESEAAGTFDQSFAVTRDRAVVVVPTPGHTLDHASVIVRSSETTYFLAGDASYTDEQLLDARPDGITPDRSMAAGTMQRILNFAEQEPVIYLPTHDPESGRRLAEGIALAA